MRQSSIAVAGVLAAAVLSCAAMARADSTVNVTPSNMNGWTFNSFDGGFNLVATGTNLSGSGYSGTAQMVNGPGGPPSQPDGPGAAYLATNATYGDGAETIATNVFNGTLLSSITTLNYWANMTTNNGSQFPYLIIGISTTGSSTADDFLEFEPPYSSQQTEVLNTWQSWDTLQGGWY